MRIGSFFMAVLMALWCTLAIVMTIPLLLFTGSSKWRLPMMRVSPPRRAWSADERRRRLT